MSGKGLSRKKEDHIGLRGLGTYGILREVFSARAEGVSTPENSQKSGKKMEWWVHYKYGA